MEYKLSWTVRPIVWKHYRRPLTIACRPFVGTATVNAETSVIHLRIVSQREQYFDRQMLDSVAIFVARED